MSDQHAAETAHPTPRQSKAPMLWLLAAAVALVVMLVDARMRGDFDPAGERRMADYPGDLAHFLGMGAVELLVLVLLIRPWSYRRSVGRLLLAVVLWLPWALFSGVVCMHCGPTGGSHVLWLFAVGLGLIVALLVSGMRVRSRGWRLEKS